MDTEIYEINSKTCALIQENTFSTIIIDNNETFTINYPINKVLNYNCAYYGSSFKGRLEGTKQLLGSKYKLPIIIEETREIIFFPTTSYRKDKCIWLSLKNISSYKEENNEVIVTFINKKQLKLNISYDSFENQLLRATKLLLILQNRKKNTK